MSLLELRNLSISFGGLKALNDVSFTVEKGEIYSIVGPNGAGKSTLFNCISRIYEPDSGLMQYGGRDILNLKAYELASLGIGRSFQNIELFDNASLLENLLIAQSSRSKSNLLAELFYLPSVKKQEVLFRRKAEEMIDFFELAHYRHSRVADLPYGVRKLTEIARALCSSPQLLLLDEPSSGLNQEETDDLSHWILDIQSELDTTVVMIDHNMDLISQVSDRVLVLSMGEQIAEGLPAEIQNNPKVIGAYLGADDA